jgi:polygalacturonase
LVLVLPQPAQAYTQCSVRNEEDLTSLSCCQHVHFSGTVVNVAASGTAISSAISSTGTSSFSAASGASYNSNSSEVSTDSVTAISACTFTDAASAISAKADCTSIVLSGITVPAGTTLDLTKLTDGTTVTFEGTTTFAFEEWEGPLMSFSGTNILIQGADDHVIDGNGAAWWDGEGSNGGTTKPKVRPLRLLKMRFSHLTMC